MAYLLEELKYYQGFWYTYSARFRAGAETKIFVHEPLCCGPTHVEPGQHFG